MITSRRDAAFAFAVFLTAVVVYANSIANGFAFDDNFIIVGNSRVHDLGNLAGIWLTPYWPTFGEELGLYRPLAIFSYAVQWAIADGAPWLFHTWSVLMHAGVSLLVFGFVRVLLANRAAGAGDVHDLEGEPVRIGALASGLLFAVHPVHTEAVANVVGQAEMMAAACVLGACWLHAARPAGIEIDWRRRVALAVLYLVGLLSKEHAIVLPALLIAVDAAQGRVTYKARSLAAYLRALAFPLVLLTLVAAAFLIARVVVLGSVIGSDANPSLPYLREQYRVLNALRAWPEFIRLLVFPDALAADYAPGVLLPAESFNGMVAVGALLLLAMIGLACATPYMPAIGLACAWFIITMLPVSNLLFPIGVLIAERTLYLPSFAIALLAGYGANHIHVNVQNPRHRRIALATAVGIVALFGLRTALRNPVWDSTQAVWRSMLEEHPESYRSHWTAANLFWARGDTAAARIEWTIAHRIYDRDSQFLAEYGNFLLSQHQNDAAVDMLRRARTMHDFVPRTQHFLAYAFYANQQYDSALVTLERARQLGAYEGNLRPEYFAMLGRTHAALGDWNRSIAAWRVAQRFPENRFWLNAAHYATTLARAGQRDAALAAVDTALALAPPQGEIERTTIAAVRTAIESGCLTAPGGCARDPLEGWSFRLYRPPENATVLQNATAR